MSQRQVREKKTGIKIIELPEELNLASLKDQKKSHSATGNAEDIEHLCDIINKGDVNKLQNIATKNKPEILSIFFNAHNKEGQTPLNLAVLKESAECVEILLSHGANPLLRDKITGKNLSPLHLAYSEEMELILEEPGELKELGSTFVLPKNIVTLLLRALPSNPFKDDNTAEAHNRRTELLKARDKYGNSLLHIAIREKCKFAALLMRYSANENINSQNKEGNTALHLAIMARNFYCILVILATKNILINIPNNQGLTAHSLFKHYLSPADLKDIQYVLQRKENLFYIAIAYNLPDLITTTATSTNDINIKNKDGDTPLHAAIKAENVDCILAILAIKNVSLDITSRDLDLLEESNISREDIGRIRHAMGLDPSLSLIKKIHKDTTFSPMHRTIDILSRIIEEDDSKRLQSIVDAITTNNAKKLALFLSYIQTNTPEETRSLTQPKRFKKLTAFFGTTLNGKIVSTLNAAEIDKKNTGRLSKRLGITPSLTLNEEAWAEVSLEENQAVLRCAKALLKNRNSAETLSTLFNMTNTRGQRLLDIAVHYEHTECMEILLKNGANPISPKSPETYSSIFSKHFSPFYEEKNSFPLESKEQKEHTKSPTEDFAKPFGTFVLEKGGLSNSSIGSENGVTYIDVSFSDISELGSKPESPNLPEKKEDKILHPLAHPLARTAQIQATPLGGFKIQTSLTTSSFGSNEDLGSKMFNLKGDSENHELNTKEKKEGTVLLHPLVRSNNEHFTNPLGNSEMQRSLTGSSFGSNDELLLDQKHTEITQIIIKTQISPYNLDHPKSKLAPARQFTALGEGSAESFASSESGSSIESDKNDKERMRRVQALSVHSDSDFFRRFPNPESAQKPEDDSVKKFGCCVIA